ncbi:MULTISPECIES: DUF2188 domain-containing protein [unclassified Flavobacterium]|uniref:DUF2188 domain-containing protein n=1 Tax=unclassified Flavobacterium TaxID=196869 RepID=UPI001F14136B|nr:MULTISPECIES: DUF2188 domain-containing protein [unclassified Flavobacterium]UMY65966.1 DUF2188 domain-containing protein [Flavobacterium sp. HJ-32-4]
MIKIVTFTKRDFMSTPRKKTPAAKLTESFKKAVTSNSKRVHVVPSKDGWAVKKEGAVRASVVSPTKAAAVKAANNIKSAERIVIHKKDGTIQSNSAKK